MRRLFTFGCSFTQYEWPTWADILGREFAYYENWGKAGAGNQFICNSVVEANLRNNFTKDDTIIVMYSSILRQDFYLDKRLKATEGDISPGWFTPGNVTGNAKEFYGEKFCDTFINPRGCYIRDLAYMHLIDIFLKEIGCSFYYLSMVDIGIPTDIYDKSFISKLLRTQESKDNECKEVLNLYSSLTSKIRPSVHNIIFNYDWQSRKLLLKPSSKTGLLHRTDSHPVPNEHLEYLQKVLPEITISDETILWTNKVTEEVCNYTFYKNTSWNPMMYQPKERL